MVFLHVIHIFIIIIIPEKYIPSVEIYCDEPLQGGRHIVLNFNVSVKFTFFTALFLGWCVLFLI